MEPVLLIDFGSTYTKVTAVDLEGEQLLGTAAAYTTVATDIGEGLHNALVSLEAHTGPLDYTRKLACSSAAGGLKMAACGLVPELTAEAARMAALGAGAKVRKVYSFQLVEDDLEEIHASPPDIFLLVGGTDGGNEKNILRNAEALAHWGGTFPVIVAGNRSCAAACGKLLGQRAILCPNVMPKLGTLNIQPTQEEIRRLFLERIVLAKGLSSMEELVSGIMMPTPSAMLDAMKLLAEGHGGEQGIGSLVGVDLGGATTDVYSMADGTPTNINTVLKGLPEPYAKRTVEGDIGMRYSIHGIVYAAGLDQVAHMAGMPPGEVEELVEQLATHTDQLPDSNPLLRLDAALARCAVKTAVTRHAGTLELVYTPTGQAYVQTGKDLSGVRTVVVTGGALIHSSDPAAIAREALATPGELGSLRPKQADILVDRSYILAAMGLLGAHYPETALRIMKKELLAYGTAQSKA